MGLSHSIDTSIGVPATYFHIQRMDVYPRDGVADITVNGFVSYEARLEDKSSVFSHSFRMTIEGDLTQSSVYQYLKESEPFTGAQDK